jgi:hypothetical protein
MSLGIATSYYSRIQLGPLSTFSHLLDRSPYTTVPHQMCGNILKNSYPKAFFKGLKFKILVKPNK